MLHVWRSEKSTWMLLAKIFFGQVKPTLSCFLGKKNTMRQAQHTNFKTTSQLLSMVDRPSWFGDVFFFFRAWTACYQWLKTEFPSLSGHFAGECAACWSSTIWVMQQENNPKRRSNSITKWVQQRKILLLEWLRPALTSTWDALWTVNNSHQISQEYCWTERVLSEVMEQISSCLLCRLDLQTQKSVGWKL